jgi:hypothetical protein
LFRKPKFTLSCSAEEKEGRILRIKDPLVTDVERGYCSLFEGNIPAFADHRGHAI